MAQEKARARWDGLTDRQRGYLRVLYWAEQKAEELARDQWTRGMRSVPASVWRWLDYGPVGPGRARLGLVQRRLDYDDRREAGGGSTLAALVDEGLIEVRRQTVTSADTYLQVQVTRAGRGVCRAGGVDPDRTLKTGKNLLSEGLWSMLAQLHHAGDGGLEGAMSAAWRYLTERRPEPLAAVEYTYPRRVVLTEAGCVHYRAH